MKWLNSLVSASFMPLDAARRRVRRSRVGLTMGKVLTAVCIIDLVSANKKLIWEEGNVLFLALRMKGVDSVGEAVKRVVKHGLAAAADSLTANAMTSHVVVSRRQPQLARPIELCEVQWDEEEPRASAYKPQAKKETRTRKVRSAPLPACTPYEVLAIRQNREKRAQTYLSEFVTLNADEIAHVVEMQVRKLATPVQLAAHLAADLHDILEHLIVAIARKQNLAGVQLVEGAAYGPHVDRIVVWHTQYNFRCPVESAHEIGSNIVVGCRRIRLVDGRAQIADLEDFAGLTDLYPGQSFRIPDTQRRVGRLPECCQALSLHG